MLSVKSIVKKMQISIMDYVMFVLDIFYRYYVGSGNESPLLVVPVRDVSMDRVGRTVRGRSVKKAVIRVRWGIPSGANICFSAIGIVFFNVVVCSYLFLKSFELSRF